MRFVETPIFTKLVRALFSDEECRTLQVALILRPEQGAVIPGSHGLRKLRWGSRGKGKRGGCRVIYYWDVPSEIFYMLFAYGKSTQEDLTPAQVRILGRLVREEFE
jgi:mRNA-degrading endonuclease RelE of RelBE toxin-antitoxin system